MDHVFGTDLGDYRPAIRAAVLHRPSAATATTPRPFRRLDLKPMPFPQPSLGQTSRSASLENKTSGPESEAERLPEGSYAKVRSFVDDFRRFSEGKLGPRSPESYENTFSIQVTPEEFSRLRSDLKMDLDDDQRSGILTSLALRVIPVYFLANSR